MLPYATIVAVSERIPISICKTLSSGVGTSGGRREMCLFTFVPTRLSAAQQIETTYPCAQLKGNFHLFGLFQIVQS